MGDGGLREIHGDDCMSNLHGVSFDKYCCPQQIGCMNHHPIATGAVDRPSLEQMAGVLVTT